MASIRAWQYFWPQREHFYFGELWTNEYFKNELSIQTPRALLNYSSNFNFCVTFCSPFNKHRCFSCCRVAGDGCLSQAMASPTENPDVTEGLRVFKLVMYIIIFVISLPANVLLLLAVSRKAYRHWNTAKSYICLIQNLAVADLLLVFFSIPFDLAWHEAQRFTYGDFMCRILWPVQTCSLQAIVCLYLALMAHRSIGVMGYVSSNVSLSVKMWICVRVELWECARCGGCKCVCVVVSVHTYV